MTRKLEVFGLLIVAMLVSSAAFVTTVQAEGTTGVFTGGFTPEVYLDTTITGEQVGTSEDNYFERGGNKITCSSASFLTTLAKGKSTSLAFTPSYGGCAAAGAPMTTSMNGCQYVFTQPTTVKPLDTGVYTGKVDLTCPTSTGIVMNTYSSGTHSISICKTELLAGTHTAGPPTHYMREFEGHVIFENQTVGEYDDVKVNMTIEGIPYKQSGLCGAKEGSDAVYRTTITMTAFDDEPDMCTTEHPVPYDTWIGHDEA